nr:hypothetical protein [Tanacetum cinerariifolium]
MQKRKKDVKARNTLLLDLPDEHQLRFNKYNTAKELWEAIIKTSGGNEATKKTKKNQLKQQYGNFMAKGSETLEQTFNRLQAILVLTNQKWNASIAIRWVILLESADHQEVKTDGRESYKKDPKVEEHAPKAMIAIDGSQKLDKDKKGVGFNEYYVVSPPLTQVCSPLKKDLSWMGLPEFVDDTVTDYTRPTPSINVSKSVDKGKTWTRVNHAQDNMKYTSTHKSMKPIVILLKSGTKPIAINRSFSTARPTLNSAQPKMTSFVKTTHSNVKRPFERKSAAKNKVWVPTVRPKIPTVSSKVPPAKPTVAADKGNKGKAVKASAHWIWKPKKNSFGQSLIFNGISVTFKK